MPGFMPDAGHPRLYENRQDVDGRDFSAKTRFARP
jgi:hypothetical protein